MNGAADSIFASIPVLQFRMSASEKVGNHCTHASFLEIPDAVLRFRHFPKIDSLNVKTATMETADRHLQVHRAELDLESGDERKLRTGCNRTKLRAEPLRFRSDGSFSFGSTDLQTEQWLVESDDGRKTDDCFGRLKIQCDFPERRRN